MFIKLISKDNIPFYFIAPSPSYDTNIPKAMFLKSLNSNNFLPNQNIEEYIFKNNYFYQFVKKNKIAKKILFSPHLYFCNDSLCKYENNYSPFYFDKVHLTLTGASELEKLFLKIAKEIKYR